MRAKHHLVSYIDLCVFFLTKIISDGQYLSMKVDVSAHPNKYEIRELYNKIGPYSQVEEDILPDVAKQAFTAYGVRKFLRILSNFNFF